MRLVIRPPARIVVLAATILVPSTVWAHVSLTFPATRTTDQKAKHCGATGSVRGTNVTTFRPGETITVRWSETVDHPGHYRISFDDDGQDFLQPPTATDSTEGIQPNVIKDLIPDLGGPLPVGGRPYEFQITLPNVECTNCTLQLIQMMTDKAPYATEGPDDNDIYYQCADITLSNTAPMPDAGGGGGGGGGDDAGVGGGGNNNTGDIGGGCSTGGAASGLPLLLGFVPLLRRRRRG